jgi:hypothetical protein
MNFTQNNAGGMDSMIAVVCAAEGEGTVAAGAADTMSSEVRIG